MRRGAILQPSIRANLRTMPREPRGDCYEERRTRRLKYRAMAALNAKTPPRMAEEKGIMPSISSNMRCPAAA